MPNKHETLTSLFDDIALSIRGKTGKSESIVADNFPDEIDSIVLGSGNAQPADVLEGKTFSNDSGAATGTMANNGAVSKSLAINETYTIPAGYHNGSGTVSQNITTKAAATYNTSASDQEIAAGQYLSGKQTIKGVSTENIEAGNIKTGVTINVGDSNKIDRIKSVSGTFTNASTITGTGKSAAAAGDILTGKAAFLDGAQLNGTMANQGAISKVLSINETYTIPAGYHNGSGKVTQNITTKGAATYNTSTSDQTIAAGQYLSGAQTIKAVKTDNLSAANVKSGTTISVGDDNDIDRIASVAGTFSASSTITGTGKSAAGAGDILTGKSAFLNGAQLDGTMPENGTLSGTITTQGGTYTIPAGHTAGGTVTAVIPPTTLDNSIISGEAIEEATGDYAWKSTVEIPAGFHNNQTLTKTFSDVFPAPGTEGTADKMLIGYQLYNHKGQLLTGTMPSVSHPNPSFQTATFNTTSGNVEVNAKHTQSLGYSAGGTSYAATNVAVGLAAINTPSGSATQSKPTFSFNASNGVLTASVAATSGTAYANVTGAGYTGTGTKSGTFTMGASSNTYTVGAAAINAPSGSKTQSTPGMTFNNVTGIVTASVGATSGTAYANITSAGYVGTATKSGTFTMGASSNTYNVGLSTITAGAGSSAATATAGTASTSITGMATTATNTGYIVSASATGGSATANSLGGSVTATAGYTDAKDISGTWNNKSASGTSASNTQYIQAAVINNPSGSGSASITSGTFAYNATAGNYGLTGSASISGTAYRNVTTEGYIKTSSTSGSISGTASLAANVAKTTVTTAVSGTISRTPVIATAATPSGVTNAASGAATTTAPNSGVYVTVASPANTATATATVSSATAGYSDGANYGKTEGTKAAGAAASATTYVPIKSGAINNPSGSKAQSTPTFSFNTTTGVVTASVAATSGTAYRNVTTAGWLGTSTTGGTFTMSASSNTYTVPAATVNSPSGSAAQSTPTFSINSATGVVTATVAAKSGTAYANVSSAGLVTAGEKNGTFSMGASSNTYTVGAGAITMGGSISGGSFTPTLTYNSTAGTYAYGGSKAASGTIYANVTTNGFLTSSGSKSSTPSATVSATGTLARTNITTAVSGGGARSHAITAGTVPSGVTNAANAAPTTTAPTSGVYVVVNAAANTTTATATVSSATAGYSDGTNYIKTQGTSTVGAAAIANTYVQIKSGAINNPSGSAAQSTPTLSINTSTGVVTASVAAKSGTAYRNVTTAGWLGTSTTGGTFSMTSSSGTLSLGTQAAKTVTPTTSAQTAVAANKYTTGAITVAGDANLVASSIVSGKSIFGVAGSAASAVAGEIVATSYGFGGMVTHGLTYSSNKVTQSSGGSVSGTTWTVC